MATISLASDTLAVSPASGAVEYNGNLFFTDSANSRGQIQRIVRGTAVNSTSGTSIDFTGIPSWVKRITVMLSNVSTNGASSLAVQLGDSGGIETAGYVSSLGSSDGTGFASTATNSFLISVTSAAGLVQSAFTLLNLSGNIWVVTGTASPGGSTVNYLTGTKTLSATLDRIRITTAGGTDTFDAGSINIMYEG